MGCGASSAPPVVVSGGFTQAQSIDGKITTENVAFRIKEKFFSWSGGDFEVKNNKDEVCYKVMGKVMTMRDKMVIHDPQGNKLCVIQKKLLDIRETYQIFRYTPNQEGQESTEQDDGTDIYRFAVIEKDIVALTPSFTYYLYKGNDEKVQVLHGSSVLMSFTFKMPIKKDEKLVANVGATSLFQFPDANTYAVEVGPGMDALGVICFAVVCDEMREQN
eukprot:TRINITY_DN67165_c0_g1_i1.p1 TRINITY_DN67165_c0_g1~~TRINITY_DN67165_c0_g1_i1.p1  ORF type:complete len:218 (-),score=48.20 TRINITY_DN67165_c0_g1_i1:181-834(-)